jgi:predicted Zn finger-like uncharacterized protein
MQTRCPGCQTHYLIDADALARAAGLADCQRCGCVFDAGTGTRIDDPPSPVLLREVDVIAPPAEPAMDEAPAENTLPFEVPDDLDPLPPSPEDVVDVAETLRGRRSRRGPLSALLVLLLATGLGLQFAWQQREELFARYPILAPICDYVDCAIAPVYAPEDLRILQREMRPSDDLPESLNLSARFRNEADAAQPLPDIQLSLVDNHGTVLIRRRLTADEYRVSPPLISGLIEPGEVVTISIDFQDPGYLATGFIIDFL